MNHPTAMLARLRLGAEVRLVRGRDRLEMPQQPGVRRCWVVRVVLRRGRA